MAATLNTDVYNIKSALDDVKKELIEEESEETLELGMYGWLSSILSKEISSAIRIGAEMGNEMLVHKARLESSIISHAITNNLSDIFAIPASMPCILGIIESDLEKIFISQGGGKSVVIDNLCKINIGEYEYHFDYPIIITKSALSNNKSAYTARYDISDPNSLSDIVNPYLPSPYLFKTNGITYLYIPITIRQVFIEKKPDKTTSESVIDNKYYEFKFANQLATFDVYVKEGNITTKLKPVFDSGDVTDLELYCRYSFLNSSTIRVTFDSNSYMPGINADITTVIKTTLGDECNFKLNTNVLSLLEDTASYSYMNIQVMIVPQDKSEGGKNKKSVKELKSIVPKEASSRGNLTSPDDLENYFNKLNTNSLRMKFDIKVNNQFMFQYYSYFLSKDSDNNIVPTNTIDALFKKSSLLKSYTSNNEVMYLLKPNTYIGYNELSGYAEIIDNPTPEILAAYNFLYAIPFKAIINPAIPSIFYYMTTINRSYQMNFNMSNDNCPVQFICSYVPWVRANATDKYTMKLSITQNINEDNSIIKEILPSDPGYVDPTGYTPPDDNGIFHGRDLNLPNVTNNLLVIIVCKKDGIPFRYFKASMTDYDLSTFTYNEEVSFITDDSIDIDNDIKISNGYASSQDSVQSGYLAQNTVTEVYILAKFPNPIMPGEFIKYGRFDLDLIVPTGIDDYSVTNKYIVNGGVDFYDNYSNIVSSIISDGQTMDSDGEAAFKVTSVPMIKYSYAQKNALLNEFVEKLKVQKDYIDEALVILKNEFTIDFNFCNTYGPSKKYTLDNGSKGLAKTNVSLHFNVSLQKASDDYTVDFLKRDIKAYIEDLNNLDSSIHLPKMMSDLNVAYASSISYLEFKCIDSYGPGYQHFYLDDTVSLSKYVPEFITIDSTSGGKRGKPDIVINVI